MKDYETAVMPVEPITAGPYYEPRPGESLPGDHMGCM